MAGSPTFSVKRVRIRANGYSYVQWKVEGRINGVRHRKFFASCEEAEGMRNRLEIKKLNEVGAVKTTVSHLSDAQLRDAEAAFHRLSPGVTLGMAVEWFQKTYRETVTDKTITEVIPLFLADRSSRVRASSLRDYRLTLELFEKHHGPRGLPEISTTEVIEFLSSRGLKGKSWNNTRADLHAFFAWCERAPRKWIVLNPAADIEKSRVERSLPEILSAEQVHEIFRYLEHYTGGKKRPHPPGCLVPYFALAVFGGLRPSTSGGELTRIARAPNLGRVIDLDQGVVRITPEIAKTGDVRQIVIQPNLKKWLLRYPASRFPILPRNYFDLICQVRAQFKIGHDVLRHTYISMHVAKFRSIGDTALQAGNSEAMIKRHYLNLVNAEEAEQFWGIVPANG